MTDKQQVIEQVIAEIGKAFDTTIRLDVPRSEFLARVREQLAALLSASPETQGLIEKLRTGPCNLSTLRTIVDAGIAEWDNAIGGCIKNGYAGTITAKLWTHLQTALADELAASGDRGVSPQEQIEQLRSELSEERGRRMQRAERAVAAEKRAEAAEAKLAALAPLPDPLTKVDRCDRCDDHVARKCFHEGCQRYDRHERPVAAPLPEPVDLRAWVQHKDTCRQGSASAILRVNAVCTCGLDAALAVPSSQEKPSTTSGLCGCDGPTRIDPTCKWHGVPSSSGAPPKDEEAEIHRSVVTDQPGRPVMAPCAIEGCHFADLAKELEGEKECHLHTQDKLEVMASRCDRLNEQYDALYRKFEDCQVIRATNLEAAQKAEARVQELERDLSIERDVLSGITTQLYGLRIRIEELKELLTRIKGWSTLDSAADGAFWRREIDKVLKP